MTLKYSEGGAGGATKTVNGLIRIAYGENVSLVARELPKNLDLREVGVLEFVNQDEAGPGALAQHEFWIGQEEFIGARDHVAEGAEVLFSQHPFYRGEYRRDLTAAAQHFLIRNLIFRLSNPRDGQLASAELGDIIRVLVRAHQFVLTAPHEVQKVVEKLADVGGTDEKIQMEFADALAQINPKILVVEHTETFAVNVKQVIAVRVKRAGLNRAVCPKLLPHAFAHFLSCVEGVSESQNFVGAGVTFTNEVGDSARDDRRDRKSTRLNSSHVAISYAVFCLKKKKHTVHR